MATAHQALRATVLWWDDKTFAVHCPFCNTTHQHLRSFSVRCRYRCIAPCDPTRDAKYKTERLNHVYCEIDKNHYRFIPGTAYSVRGESPSNSTANHDPNIPRIALSASSRSLLLTADLDQRNKSKAIAGMRRKGGLPDVFAVSGWTDIGDAVIASKHWTEQALQLCQLIGYELTPDVEKDQGVPGRFNASHVEKQLAAYFIHSHAFLSHELDLSGDVDVGKESDDDLAGLIGKLDLQETAEASPRRHRLNGRQDGIDRERITALWKVSPPRMLKNAIILVTRTVCSDCKEFIRCLNSKMGLRIEAYSVCYETIKVSTECVDN